ncbi:unnamed protein product [Caenorhabditis sp. 36 PRJEB53466]|nr:unnamed protein product [Caenorhabditis sp. 36 PRJEB53466]
MLSQSHDIEVHLTPSLEPESSTKQLEGAFKEMESTSDSANYVAIAVTETPNTPQLALFNQLTMLASMSQQNKEPIRMKRPKYCIDESKRFQHGIPESPVNSFLSQWDLQAQALQSSNLDINQMTYMQNHNYLIPRPLNDPMTDEELVNMKGPSRLIGFLVHIAMNDRARRALRWTGNDLEFILINKELVAQMWGNRKHNTKKMDYYKLSRAIREKYEKKDGDSIVITKCGKLKKGTRTYCYVFTEHAYSDLLNETKMKTIEDIKRYAASIGYKYRDNTDINPSPQAQSPLHSDE